MDFLNPVGNPSLSWELAGFAEGVHTIFISSEIGVFTIELKSGQVKKLCECKKKSAESNLAFRNPKLRKIR